MHSFNKTGIWNLLNSKVTKLGRAGKQVEQVVARLGFYNIQFIISPFCKWKEVKSLNRCYAVVWKDRLLNDRKRNNSMHLIYCKTQKLWDHSNVVPAWANKPARSACVCDIFCIYSPLHTTWASTNLTSRVTKVCPTKL